MAEPGRPCPHDDIDVGFDDDGEPMHVLCLQCHGLWPVSKVKPVEVALELLKDEPVKDELEEVTAERDRLRAVADAARRVVVEADRPRNAIGALMESLAQLDVSRNIGGPDE